MTQTIVALGAIALVAVVMIMGALAPVMAVPDEDKKVTICHFNETISVSVNAVEKHMTNHGDTMGACS